MTICDYCGLRYSEDLREDRREHEARHKRFIRAELALRYVPGTHADRETAKMTGGDIVHGNGTLRERVSGAELILRAWFDRSLSTAIECGYWRRHPTFEAYVAVSELLDTFPQDVQRELRRQYGRKPVEIAPGYSFWFPPGADRERQWAQHRRDRTLKAPGSPPR